MPVCICVCIHTCTHTHTDTYRKLLVERLLQWHQISFHSGGCFVWREAESGTQSSYWVFFILFYGLKVFFLCVSDKGKENLLKSIALVTLSIPFVCLDAESIMDRQHHPLREDMNGLPVTHWQVLIPWQILIPFRGAEAPVLHKLLFWHQSRHPFHSQGDGDIHKVIYIY